MRGRLNKLLVIFAIIGVTGFFMQFTLDTGEYNESELSAARQRPPFLTNSTTWTDSVMEQLSLQEKIGQMLMVAAYPNEGEEDKRRVTDLIKKHNVGGIIFFQGTAGQVSELTAYYQSISKIPLMIAIDGEWGLATRLENSIKYPKQMMLGAVTEEMLIYEMGKDIASQMKHIGVHVNFAPVVDVNNNPENPVISSRSFGEGRVNVARKGILYTKGLQDEGVLAVTKHFPGHGDAQTDSHLSLPKVSHNQNRLDSLELYPFRALINAGVGGIMTAHMNVQSLDSTRNLPATLSAKVVDSLLLRRLAFKGLVFTDALNKKGVLENRKPEEVNLMALKAGNDILLMPLEEKKSIQAIKRAVDSGSVSLQRINYSCKKILKAKEWIFGKYKKQEFDQKELHKEGYYLTRKKIIESAITVVKNTEKIVPLKNLDTLNIAHVSLGPDSGKNFANTLRLYTKVDTFTVRQKTDSVYKDNLLNSLSAYNLVLISLHSSSIDATTNFGITKEETTFIKRLIAEVPTIFVSFANPYVMRGISNLNNSQAFIEAYENDSVTQSSTAQLIFGAVRASGKLPVSIDKSYREGTGYKTEFLQRFKYVSPYEAGFNSESLKTIDSIVADAIQNRAVPGCQVFAARNGKVFLNKAYGYHTYSQKIEVKHHDVYDLASLTKISATLPAVIKLQEEKVIDIDERLGSYFPELDTSNKKDLILSDILLHQAGLTAWIPFFWSTLEPIYPGQKLFNGKYSESYPIKMGKRAYANKHIKYKEGYFAQNESEEYPFKVTDNMFMRKELADSVWIKIAESPLKRIGKYKYSDLGFYLLYKLVENRTKSNFTEYLDSLFYKPLGANSLCYNPLRYFDREVIVPTENDLVFRKQLVHGYVHDPGAAMLGGVSGHAGLFGNANDLAKLMQMYLNWGRYGGKEYLNKKLVKKFSSCAACDNGNRRGLGFDKPQQDSSRPGPGFKGISTESFGHTGFTGTMAWVDPSTDIVYIFLSNRIYPDASNTKLISMDVRTKIQETIYKAVVPEDK